MPATVVPTVSSPAPLVQTGFTQVANRVLSDPRLSPPARLLYALLKMHAWQSAVALPGQVRLGALLGVQPRQVRRYLAELVAAGLVVCRHRGRNLTNEYYLAEAPAPKGASKEAPPQAPPPPADPAAARPGARLPALLSALPAAPAPPTDGTSMTAPGRTPRTALDGTPMTATEYSVKNTQKKNTDSTGPTHGGNSSDTKPDGPTPPYSPYIAGVTLDICREIGDLGPPAAGARRALSLWTRSGLPEADFVTALHGAKAALRHRQTHVTNRGAYFFTLLAEAVGVPEGGGAGGLRM
jgi:hypothetical protein